MTIDIENINNHASKQDENNMSLLRGLLNLQRLDAVLTDIAESGMEITELATLLLELNRTKRELSVVYDSFSQKVMNLMGDVSLVEIPSGGSIEKKGATERKKWRHPELATRVAERLSEMSVDMDTGEVITDAQSMVVKLLDYAAVSYWRVGKLGEIGINPDSYCEQGDYKTNLVVREGSK